MSAAHKYSTRSMNDKKRSAEEDDDDILAVGNVAAKTPATNNKKMKTTSSCECSTPTNTCALCLENMTGAVRNVVAALPCGHLYHEDCFAGLQASVLEKPPDLYEDEDEDEPPAIRRRTNQDIKCPTCNQKVDKFGRIFLNLGTVEKADTQAAVVVSMETLVRTSLWNSDEYIVESALKRIFAINRDSETSFLFMGGHVAVLRAMERHSSKSLIQWYGAKIIFELSKNHATVLNAIGVSKALLAAMKTHPSHRGILAISCAILSNICKDDMRRSAIAEEAVPLAVAAMKRFPADELVQIRGCCFLREVASDHQLNLVMIGFNDGVVPIVTAMKRHPNTEEIQASGCALLGELAGASNGNKRAIYRHGGVVAVAAALERFFDTPHRNVWRNAQVALTQLSQMSGPAL